MMDKIDVFIAQTRNMIAESLAYAKHTLAAKQMEQIMQNDPKNKDHVLQTIKYHLRAANTAPNATLKKLHDNRIKQILN